MNTIQNKVPTNEKIKILVYAALLCALTFVGTMLIQIPTGTNGYIHIGDGFVLLCGYMLGPVWGALAAGIGSALVDISTSYMLWAPGTFVIKALMAAIACIVFRFLTGKTKLKSLSSAVFSGILSELFMVVGYFFYAALILGNGLSAAASIPSNSIQGVTGVIISTLIINIFIHNKRLSSFLPEISVK